MKKSVWLFGLIVSALIVTVYPVIYKLNGKSFGSFFIEEGVWYLGNGIWFLSAIVLVFFGIWGLVMYQERKSRAETASSAFPEAATEPPAATTVIPPPAAPALAETATTPAVATAPVIRPLPLWKENLKKGWQTFQRKCKSFLGRCKKFAGSHPYAFGILAIATIMVLVFWRGYSVKHPAAIAATTISQDTDNHHPDEQTYQVQVRCRYNKSIVVGANIFSQDHNLLATTRHYGKATFTAKPEDDILIQHPDYENTWIKLGDLKEDPKHPGEPLEIFVQWPMTKVKVIPAKRVTYSFTGFDNFSQAQAASATQQNIFEVPINRRIYGEFNYDSQTEYLEFSANSVDEVVIVEPMITEFEFDGEKQKNLVVSVRSEPISRLDGSTSSANTNQTSASQPIQPESQPEKTVVKVSVSTTIPVKLKLDAADNFRGKSFVLDVNEEVDLEVPVDTEITGKVIWDDESLPLEFTAKPENDVILIKINTFPLDVGGNIIAQLNVVVTPS